MARKIVFTVGFELPTKEDFQYVDFNSMTSLLDADIVLFETKLKYEVVPLNPTFEGRPNLTDESSHECRQSVAHWRGELKRAAEAGKTIIVYCRAPEDVFVLDRITSGTGKFAKSTRNLSLLNSFKALPVTFKTQKVAKGNSVKATKEGDFIKQYWSKVGFLSQYEIYFDIEEATPVLQTKHGQEIVGALVRTKDGGSVLFLPPLNLPPEFFVEKEDKHYWSQDAIVFGKTLLAQILEIDRILRSEHEQSSIPEWISEEIFMLKDEIRELKTIETIKNDLNKLKEKLDQHHEKLKKAFRPKHLLYENGKALENAILEALVELGFNANNYNDGESEFDIVFESEEGRFIGEAEGKDTSAINIQKLQQLERNIQEDYARDEITKHAKGVLFGNSFRLDHPKNRKNCFTEKAISSAKRSGFALVNTHDLFFVLKIYRSTKDKQYAKKIREAIAQTSGEVVKFPSLGSDIAMKAMD